MVPQPSSAVAGGLPSRPSHASGSTHHEQSKTFSESSRAAEPSAHASNHAGSLPAPASAGQKGLPKPDARTTDASGRRLAAQRAAPNRTRGGRAPAASDGPKGWGHQRPMMATPGHIQQLKDMGFTEEVARQALAACAWDVNRALDMLFTQAASKSSPASGGAADRGQAARSDDVASRTGAEKASAWANLVTPVKPGLGDAANSITGSTVSSPRSSGRTEEWTAIFPSCQQLDLILSTPLFQPKSQTPYLSRSWTPQMVRFTTRALLHRHPSQTVPCLRTHSWSPAQMLLVTVPVHPILVRRSPVPLQRLQSI